MAESSVPAISIFGGEYNAKRVSLKSVAETFVPPDGVFERLIAQDNSLLIGPRGAGKTTLLRMLQGRALELWEAPDADRVREAISYTGVFVPADQAWAEQLRADDLDGGAAREFAVGAFTLHCLRALVNAADDRLKESPTKVSHRRLSLAADDVHRIAQEVSKIWMLHRPVADLTDLGFALTEAIVSLGAARYAEAKTSEEGRSERLAAILPLRLSFLSAAIAFIERFNQVCGDAEGRWAFLFDEVELVPTSIESLIMGCLRGVDERLLFKVSYAPYERDEELSSFQSPLGAQPGQDYSVLRLTYANKREGFPFSRALLEAELLRKRITRSPEQVLGSTSLIVGDEDAESDSPASALDYGPGGAAVQMLEELGERDPSFREYLERQGFDISALRTMPEAERARIRKIMPLVAVRLAYRRSPESRASGLRGRRNVGFYSGAEAFYSMMEANPRWLKHVTERMLKGGISVPPQRQSAVLRDAAKEFAGYLSVLPMRGSHVTPEEGPKLLMRRIGTYFRDGYLGPRFNPDSPGSLRVDRDFSETVMTSLRALVNRGALIPVPEPEEADLRTLVGKRFRLAYLQAPLYGLPLRLDRAVPLSEILDRSPRGQMSLGEAE
jgi:hypothetical protein